MKKWALVQVWRVQQIAMVASLSLLAINLSLTVNGYIQWRFNNSWVGTVIVLLVLAVIIWFFGYVWDKRLKLWKTQMVVTAERNPYSTIHMTPKEIMVHTTLWIPFLRERGYDEYADFWWRVIQWNLKHDPSLKIAIEEMGKI